MYTKSRKRILAKKFGLIYWKDLDAFYNTKTTQWITTKCLLQILEMNNKHWIPRSFNDMLRSFSNIE